MHDSGVDLVTVEIQQGDRPFAITSPDNPNHIQLITQHELWLKECALNIAAKRLYELWPDWKYMAWIDADVMFLNPAWVTETISALQRHRVVQLWTTCVDLNHQMNPLNTIKSFAWCYRESLRNPDSIGVEVDGKFQYNMGTSEWKHYAATGKPFWHSGFAWAIRRKTYEDLGGPHDGGIFELGILGSGDHHMALAFIGDVTRSCPNIKGGYQNALQEYQTRCDKFVQKDLGYIDGTIAHYFHGSKVNRHYRTRWNILLSNDFEPLHDLKKDPNGLYMLTDRNIKLRDEIRLYFESRDEDNPNS